MPRDLRAAVYLHERRVGTLVYHDGNTWFDYTDRDPAHPVLGQAFENAPERRRTASGSVPEWFANLLPEQGSGLRDMVAAELGERNVHDFRLLTHLGEDLPGAVRVQAETGSVDIVDHMPTEECSHDHPLRFSLAGVQPKFSMRQEGKGLTLPHTGWGGDWIVKLPDRRFRDVPRNEHAMLEWARHGGIDVPEVWLVRGAELDGLPTGLVEPDEWALATRRFDRTTSGRVHQEDFAQVREVPIAKRYDRASYCGLGRVIDTVCPEDDVVEYVRRLALTVVCGNLDAHLKNWTLRYPDGRRARLSPAYDLVCVTAYPDYQQDRLAFSLGGTTAPGLVTIDNFRRLADRIGIGAELVEETVAATTHALQESWPRVERECEVPDFLAAHITQRCRDIPLCRWASGRGH